MYRSKGYLILCQGIVCKRSCFIDLQKSWREKKLYPQIYLTESDCLGVCKKSTALLVWKGTPRLLAGLDNYDVLLDWAASSQHQDLPSMLPKSLLQKVIDE